MLAFGCSITKRDVFDRFAAPGIARAREPDSIVYDLDSLGSIQATYNAILDRAAAEPQLDGLALLHQDLEIQDPEFAAKVRRRFRGDPDVAVIGIAGGRGVRDMAWWECEQVLGCWRWEYHEHGGGVLDTSSFDNFVPGSEHGCHEVDSVDGMLLVLSPWAVRELRFDEGFGSPIHGYDVDLCFQARAAGRKVVVDELHATHHHEFHVVTDSDDWIEAFVRFQRKWEGRLPGVGIGDGERDWEELARRAVAEARAARIERNELGLLRNEADRRLLAEYERSWELQQQLENVLATRTWRYTEPIRRAAALARRARARIQRSGRVKRPKRFS